MSTLAEFMIVARADNRPPMLDKAMYDSWESRMELFIEGKENGKMMLNSVKNGPLIWPTYVEENGTTRVKTYEELSVTEKLQADCDVRAANLVLQGLPPDQDRECKLYDEFDKFAHVKGETLHQYYLSLISEWSKFITDVKLAMDLHTTNYDQLHAYLQQHELHANDIWLTRERYQDPLVLLYTPAPMADPYDATYHPQFHNPINPQYQNQVNQLPSPGFPSTITKSELRLTKKSSKPIQDGEQCVAGTWQDGDIYRGMFSMSRALTLGVTEQAGVLSCNYVTISRGRIRILSHIPHRTKMYALSSCMVSRKVDALLSTREWIEQYLQVQDYALWDVIENGNSFKPAAQTTPIVDGSSTTLIPGPVTADEKTQKKNDVKARSILLMALPNEHLLTFNQYKDAKTLFAAIQTRFGGNYATKKTQIEQYLQVQNYALWDVIENGNSFKPAAQTTPIVDGSSTTLIPGPVTADEKTQKKNDVKARSILLMALPNEHLLTFNQYKDAKTLFAAIQTRFGGFRRLNKPDLDTMSFDDLYNNFKIVKQEVKGSANSSSSSSSQNMDFVSSLSSTNKVNTAHGISTANTQVSPASTQVSTASTQVSTANLSDTTVYAFLTSQPNGSHLVHEDLKQIHEDNLEEMDLKWQLALLSMRTRRFF
ncbi:hypothetical protein Tco_0643626 [Tanacetum coccineum]